MVDILTAVREGQQYANALRDQREERARRQMIEGRQDRAYDALEAEYGAIAGDPTLAGQLGGIQQRQEAHDFDMQTGRDDRQRLAARNAVGLLTAARDRGEDVGMVFDRLSTVLPALGVSPDQIGPLRDIVVSNPAVLDDLTAQLGAENRRAIGSPRSVIGPDGQPVLAQFYQDGSYEILEGLTPTADLLAAQRLEQGQDRIGLGYDTLGQRRREQYAPSRQAGVVYVPDENGIVREARVVPGSPQETSEREARAEATAAEGRRGAALANVQRAAATVTRDADEAINMIQRSGAFTEGGTGLGNIAQATRRRAAAQVPGTDEYEIQRLIDSVKSNVGIDALLNIKREGAGLGQVPQSQLETLQELLGNLDITRRPDLLLRDLQNISALYSQIQASAEADLQAIARDQSAVSPSGRGGPVVFQDETPNDLANASDDDLFAILGGN